VLVVIRLNDPPKNIALACFWGAAARGHPPASRPPPRPPAGQPGNQPGTVTVQHVPHTLSLSGQGRSSLVEACLLLIQRTWIRAHTAPKPWRASLTARIRQADSPALKPNDAGSNTSNVVGLRQVRYTPLADPPDTSQAVPHAGRRGRIQHIPPWLDPRGGGPPSDLLLTDLGHHEVSVFFGGEVGEDGILACEHARGIRADHTGHVRQCTVILGGCRQVISLLSGRAGPRSGVTWGRLPLTNVLNFLHLVHEVEKGLEPGHQLGDLRLINVQLGQLGCLPDQLRRHLCIVRS
jgi:hypothetical protein